MSKIDINEIANNPKLSLSISSNQDEHPKDACLRRLKEITLFFVTLIVVLIFFAFCCYVVLDHGFSTDDKKWATAIATSIISALLGYLTGKNTSLK